MLHDVHVVFPGRLGRPAVYELCTTLQAQNVLASFIQDGHAEFTLTVKKHVHEHVWSADRRDIDDKSIIVACDTCYERFSLPQELISAHFANETVKGESS